MQIKARRSHLYRLRLLQLSIPQAEWTAIGCCHIGLSPPPQRAGYTLGPNLDYAQVSLSLHMDHRMDLPQSISDIVSIALQLRSWRTCQTASPPWVIWRTYSSALYSLFKVQPGIKTPLYLERKKRGKCSELFSKSHEFFDSAQNTHTISMQRRQRYTGLSRHFTHRNAIKKEQLD